MNYTQKGLLTNTLAVVAGLATVAGYAHMTTPALKEGTYNSRTGPFGIQMIESQDGRGSIHTLRRVFGISDDALVANPAFTLTPPIDDDARLPIPGH